MCSAPWRVALPPTSTLPCSRHAKAFDDGRWARRAPAQRKKVLLAWAEKILAAKEELALLETLDMGKPIRYSLAVDVPSTARCIAWYAEAVDKIYDEIAPTPQSALALITREPMGVIGAVVPWNYPMIMAAWKLGPALAAGNSVVLKPSEKSPLTAMRLAELAVEGRPARGGCSTSCPATATKPARRWRCIRRSMRSASPAPRAWAARCWNTPAAAT